jgi:hypothetical protein
VKTIPNNKMDVAMIQRQFTKTFLVVGVAASLALASALVFAGHETTVPSYTGCLNVNGGTFVSVAAGNAPQSPCGPSQIQVHLSGGDITAVTAGSGLQGGAASGAATLSLQSSYQLPQGCSGGGVPKWTGTAWECGTDADTETVAFGGFSEVGFGGVVEGVPNDEAPIGRLLLPAGKYAIFAKVWIYFVELDSDLDGVICTLSADSDADRGRLSTREGGNTTAGVISLMLLHEFTGDGFAEMSCEDNGGDELLDHSDASWSNLRITAIKLGSFQNGPLVQ